MESSPCDLKFVKIKDFLVVNTRSFAKQQHTAVKSRALHRTDADVFPGRRGSMKKRERKKGKKTKKSILFHKETT